MLCASVFLARFAPYFQFLSSLRLILAAASLIYGPTAYLIRVQFEYSQKVSAIYCLRYKVHYKGIHEAIDGSGALLREKIESNVLSSVLFV